MNLGSWPQQEGSNICVHSSSEIKPQDLFILSLVFPNHSELDLFISIWAGENLRLTLQVTCSKITTVFNDGIDVEKTLAYPNLFRRSTKSPD